MNRWEQKHTELLISAYENRIPICSIEELTEFPNNVLAKRARDLGLSEKYPEYDYMVGRTYGRLKVLRVQDRGKNGKSYMCQCICGNTVVVLGSNLKTGNTTSCGCFRVENTIRMDKSRTDNLIGQTFGYLTVIERGNDYVSPAGHAASTWKCKCVCGKVVTLPQNRLKNGGVKSCGCMKSTMISDTKKGTNKYDLSGEYGIGYDDSGREFYFDLEDYNKIKDYKWYINENGYAVSFEVERNRKVWMHRLVMGLSPSDDLEIVDHIHSERQNDNRKNNLRIVTSSQNSMNRALASNNTSGTTGVSWHKGHGLWGAYIGLDRKLINLGYYPDINDAIAERKKAEEQYFGEYSYDNSQANDI